MIQNEQLDQLTKIWLVSESNPSLRSEIELKLIEATKDNQRFSREYFYAWFATRQKPVLLHFIPGSISYIDYGPQVVVVPRFMMEVIPEIEKNITDNVNTYGLVMAEDIYDSIPMDVRKKLLVTGFMTNHVREVVFL